MWVDLIPEVGTEAGCLVIVQDQSTNNSYKESPVPFSFSDVFSSGSAAHR